MKKISLAGLSTLAIAIFCLVLFAPKANALSGSQFNPGRIIDDSVFFDSGSMTASQIQNFLNSKMPSCDTNGTKPYGGTTRANYGTSRGYPPPYICLKNYSQTIPTITNGGSDLCKGSISGGKKTAARIINDVAKACQTSPKVLLVLLQKEQSLVTDDWPWSIQYRSATGYGCPDTAPCDSEYYGYFNQVYQAAKAYQRYKANPDNYNYKANRNNTILWHPNAACGSSNVFIQNQATAGLYIYTPYRPNQAALNNLYGTGNGCSSYGNRNFWRMFSDWFGYTTKSYIVNVPGSSTLYLNYNNVKYGIPSQNVLRAYGFDKVPVSSVSSSYLNSQADGGILSTLFKFEGSGTVRLADHGKDYGISSSAVCDNWGLSCFDPNYVKVLPAYMNGLLISGGALKNLMWTQNDSYSLMVNGKKSPFIGNIADFGYTAQSATAIDNPVNYTRPYTAPKVSNNTLIKFGNSSGIYYHYNNNYYSFPSMSTFQAWTKNTGKKIYTDTRSSFSSSPPASSGAFDVLVHHGTSKFLIINGKKYYINSVAADWPATVSHTFALAFLSELKSGTLNSDYLFRSETGTIYQVKNKARNHFVSLKDFYAYGGASKPMLNVSNELTNRLGAGNILLGHGSLFKPSSSSAIYVVGFDNSSSYLLKELAQIKRLGLNNTRVLDVDAGTANMYPSSGSFSDFIKVGSGYYALSRNSQKISFNAAANVSRWGLDLADAKQFVPSIGNSIASSSIDPRFIVSPSGAIYYGHSSSKRLIGSYSKYKALGGHSNNTFNGSSSFLNLLPTGSPIN